MNQTVDHKYGTGHRSKKKTKRKKPLLLIGMLILDLVLIFAAGTCMYHFFHTPQDPVAGREQVLSQKSHEVKQANVTEDPKERTKEALKKRAKKLYEEHGELLLLVNKERALPAGYQVKLKELENGDGQVAEVMYQALTDMLADGARQGYAYALVSGYRDAAYQDTLIQRDIQKYMTEYGMDYGMALDKTLEQVMPSGYSEHETGLAIDITAAGHVLLEEEQERTQENQWMREECWKYGFVLRYPKGKEDITGILYEPWHFRYVGKETAKFLQEEELTLEEFYELLDL